MKINQIFLISLLCSTAMISAAADKEEDDDNQILTFYTPQLEGMDQKRLMPGIHCVNRNSQETLSGKTFKELFKTNACEKNIPWLLSVCLIKTQDERSVVHYLDLLEFFKMQNHRYQGSDFASHEKTEQTLAKVFNEPFSVKTWRTHYPTSKSITCDISCLYYASKNSMHFENSKNQHPTKSFILEGHNTVSDLSCALAIALCNDYSQLLQIISIFAAHEATITPDELQKKDFWRETFLALSDEQRQQLLQEFKDRFGLNLVITKPN